MLTPLLVGGVLQVTGSITLVFRGVRPGLDGGRPAVAVRRPRNGREENSGLTACLALRYDVPIIQVEVRPRDLPEQKAIQAQVLYMNMVDYWYEVDLNGGAGVAEMYVEDGIFHGGPGKPLVGRAAIEQFATWRTNRGARTSRHVITNFRADFADDGHATTYSVMLLYAADGALDIA